jgi:LysR family transcriptional regulator, benzoate and cis,cis-muconate-responsive activator of ben and cat genes
MNLNQLRYFSVVARERNFTRAAAELHIAQPPLSRQIQLLEEELGVRLLDRDVRPLQLTQAGRFLYDQALQILSRFEQVRVATRRIGRAERPSLIIGFVASTLYSGLPPLIRRLRSELPDLDIQLVEMISIQQIEALKDGRIDVGFGRIRLNDPAVERVVILEERLVVAAPAHSRFAVSDDPFVLEDLSSETLIVFPREPRPSFADQVLSFLAYHGVTAGEVHEVRELQAALGLVAAEVGLCLVPASAQQLRAADVHYRPLAEENATSPIILSYRANDRSESTELVKTLAREMESI